jgi:hypothetical protein
MSKDSRQKLSILIVLLAVLSLTLVLGYRMNRPEVTAAVQPPDAKTSANPPAPTDARIRLDLVEKPPGSAEEIGRRNFFQYRQAPAPVVAGQRGGTGTTPGMPSAPGNLPASPGRGAGPVTPPAPPAPPPIPLKFQGYAVSRAPAGQMTAFLTDDAARHYNVSAGEILMGRYRITQISPTFVEVEDIELNRRQTLPLLK